MRWRQCVFVARANSGCPHRSNNDAQRKSPRKRPGDRKDVLQRKSARSMTPRRYATAKTLPLSRSAGCPPGRELPRFSVGRGMEGEVGVSHKNGRQKESRRGEP